METENNPLDHVSAKLIACAVIVACLIVGVIGLILPIVPGLLFIAIAAVVAAKVFPAFGQMLRRNDTIGAYLNRADGLVELPLGKKIQVACLLCVKMFIDGVALLTAGVTKIVRAAERA